jgi:AAA15 family ATPase/GTPase
MLLEFRVANYRSFYDEQVLSLVASADRHLSAENTASTNAKGVRRALRSAVIYGANASGKSNLLRALAVMRAIVVQSAQLGPEQPLNVQPFRLARRKKLEATLFEVTVVLEGVRYQYGFELTTQRITREWLQVYKASRPQTWIDRTYDAESDRDGYASTPLLAGQKAVWQEATKRNSLFLSVAVQLNSEQLAPLHKWFSSALVVLLDGATLPFSFSTTAIQSKEGAASISQLMRSADIAIDSVSAVARKGLQRQFQLDLHTGEASSQQIEGDVMVPLFTHRAGDQTAIFEFAEESQGTQKLFSLAGPLMDILAAGKTLVIDELDRSLHPLLVRQIVNTFHDPDTSGPTPQLLYTTHDTTLLDSTLLRRDQVWLTEKGADQASRLVPLMEYSPRKNEALERGYLGGRYGGVPILDERLKVMRLGQAK